MLNKIDMAAFVDDIHERYGIELTWGEKAALSYYIEDCVEKVEKSREDLGENTRPVAIRDYQEGEFAFMRDYFGLDFQALFRKDINNLEEVKRWMRKYAAMFVKYPFSYELGANMIYTPEFREYCRRHVQEWRDERDML